MDDFGRDEWVEVVVGSTRRDFVRNARVGDYPHNFKKSVSVLSREKGEGGVDLKFAAFYSWRDYKGLYIKEIPIKILY